MIQPQKNESRKETRQSELQEVAVKMISIVTANTRGRIIDSKVTSSARRPESEEQTVDSEESSRSPLCHDTQ